MNILLEAASLCCLTVAYITLRIPESRRMAPPGFWALLGCLFALIADIRQRDIFGVLFATAGIILIVTLTRWRRWVQKIWKKEDR
jgi:drug/metabolite transporter superfamily protein YnfA